jgi:2-C-methyl-D-erythritol 4-phosphate cytidylyltransferase
VTTYSAIVPAAGSGRRFGASIPKQYLALHGLTVLEHSLNLLLRVPRLQHIVVVLDPHDQRWRELSVFSDPRIVTTAGGAERCHSVLNGLQHLATLSEINEWVLVHDVARPCCPLADIERLLDQLARHPVGGLLAVPASDTIKRVDAARQVTETVDRAWLWQAQTDAMAHCIGLGMTVTDEAQAVEELGWQAQVIEGSKRNIKITRPEDLALAEFFLQSSIG